MAQGFKREPPKVTLTANVPHWLYAALNKEIAKYQAMKGAGSPKERWSRQR
jgi:hypothetical protein